MLGVATYALELFRSTADLDVLYVPIGQGSGISGCILARDLLGLKTEIVGVQSTEAPSYALSFKAGTVVSTNSSNTRADGMATSIPDPHAFDIIRKGASRIVEVTDDEIGEAIRCLWTDTHNLSRGRRRGVSGGCFSGKGKAERKTRRADPQRRQYRFRAVSQMGDGGWRGRWKAGDGMSALSHDKHSRHGRAWPGHPRLTFYRTKDVDARHKAGHDDGEIGEPK